MDLDLLCQEMLNRTPDDFGPEGRPPIHLDKDIANIAKNEIKQVKTESFDQNIESAKFTGSGNIKRNLFSSFDILLANPLHLEYLVVKIAN